MSDKKKSSFNKRFISMLSDYGFKVTFANESETTFLRKAIQALIQSKTQIKEVTFQRNELAGITKSSRGGLYDVICVDEQERKFIIEMQVTNLKHFIHRAKFYGFYHLNILVKRGQYRFNDLKKIYVISILGGIAYPELKEYHHKVSLRNQHGNLIDNQIEHILIELGKWNKSIEDIEADNLDIDKLLYLMKMTHELSIDETKFKDFKAPTFLAEDWIQQAMKELDMSQMSPEKRAIAEMRLLQEAQLAYHYEDEVKRLEEARIKAEEQKNRAEEEKRKVEEQKNRAEKALAQAERKGHKLLVSSLLKINCTISQIAELQNWEEHYIEELINEIKHN